MSLVYVALLFSLASQPTTPSDNILLFRTDENAVKNVISQGEIADAMVTCASALYRWQDHPLFGELVDHVIYRTYKGKPTGQLHKELDRRFAVLEEGAPWEIWLETGLAALAAHRASDAQYCFIQCLNDETFKTNPYPHLLLGRSLLAQRKIEEAQLAYQDAVNAASTDLSTAFYVRYLYASDLYKAGKVSLTRCESGPVCDSLASPYPLERVYGIYENLMYAWSLGDSSEVARLTTDLEEALAEARARPDSPFENRRVKEATNFLRRIKQARAGDDYIAMILDEESCEFDRWSGDHEGVYNRLVKWRARHPISEYATLTDKEQKFALTSIHFELNVSACRTGRLDEAEIGFRDFINAVPFEQNGEMVSASLLWLGHTLHRQRRTQAAVDIYHQAALLIPVSSYYYPSLLGEVKRAQIPIFTGKE